MDWGIRPATQPLLPLATTTTTTTTTTATNNLHNLPPYSKLQQKFQAGGNLVFGVWSSCFLICYSLAGGRGIGDKTKSPSGVTGSVHSGYAIFFLLPSHRGSFGPFFPPLQVFTTTLLLLLFRFSGHLTLTHNTNDGTRAYRYICLVIFFSATAVQRRDCPEGMGRR